MSECDLHYAIAWAALGIGLLAGFAVGQTWEIWKGTRRITGGGK